MTSSCTRRTVCLTSYTACSGRLSSSSSALWYSCAWRHAGASSPSAAARTTSTKRSLEVVRAGSRHRKRSTVSRRKWSYATIGWVITTVSSVDWSVLGRRWSAWDRRWAVLDRLCAWLIDRTGKYIRQWSTWLCLRRAVMRTRHRLPSMNWSVSRWREEVLTQRRVTPATIPLPLNIPMPSDSSTYLHRGHHQPSPLHLIPRKPQSTTRRVRKQRRQQRQMASLWKTTNCKTTTRSLFASHWRRNSWIKYRLT